MAPVSDDLRSLVRHVSRMLLLSGSVTAVGAVGVFIAGADELADNRFADAGIVLSALAVLQVFFWFALVYWVDTRESPAQGRDG